MKEVVSIAALGIVAVAMAGIDAATAKKELDALTPKVQAAFQKEDVSVLAGMLADNFVWKHKDGRPNENKKQTIEGLKGFFAAADGIRVKWVMKSFSVKGNKAVLVSAETMTCRIMQDNKSHTMKTTSSSRETWVKTAKGWKATMFEDVGAQKMWMDGKPFDPKKAMGGG